MVQPDQQLEIHCPRCRWSEVVGPAGALRWLEQAEMLTRRSQPSAEEVLALLPAAAEKLPCPECAERGLEVGPPREESEDWGDARRCERCGAAVEPERLELFPDTEYCGRCRRDIESGNVGGAEVEYCPRCGSPMLMKAAGGRGVTRYKMVCSGGCRR